MNKSHNFVHTQDGKVIYCSSCGAIKYSYYISRAEMKEYETPKAEAPCPY